MKKKNNLLKKIAVIVPLITIICGSITGVMTYINIGYTDVFFTRWLSSFILAIAILAPTGFIISAVINKIVKILCAKQSTIVQNIIFGLIMAIVMESIMAIVTTTNTIGLDHTSLFAQMWLKAFLTALPLGIGISLLMSLSIKAKIEKFLAG